MGERVGRRGKVGKRGCRCLRLSGHVMRGLTGVERKPLLGVYKAERLRFDAEIWN
jgi:hypothetical protein